MDTAMVAILGAVLVAAAAVIGIGIENYLAKKKKSH